MNKLELFIKEKQVNVSEMERKLGLPHKSLKMGRGIPRRHVEKIEQYLVENYEYGGEGALDEADPPGGDPVVQRRWNKDFVPGYKDGILRYQDPDNGLWKRLYSWQSWVVKDTGEVKMNEGFLPAGEELSDKFGKYYMAKNGIKIYKFI